MPNRAHLVLAFSLAFAMTAAAETPTETTTFTPAMRLDQSVPRYPWNALKKDKEGWVTTSYCIRVDGTVVDPLIEESSGIEEFERAVLRALPTWQYTPARRNGVPVEQCDVSVLMAFAIESGDELGARMSFVRDWRALDSKIEAGDLDGASAALELMQAENLYESARISLARAQIAAKRGDHDAQLAAVRDALHFPEKLEKPLATKLRRQRFALELELQNYAAALHSLEALEELDAKHLSDSERDAGVQLRTLIASTNTLSTPGKLVRRCGAESCSPVWGVGMLRREFAFFDGVGKLERFELRCKERRFTSPFSTEASYKIPLSWGDCTLFVFGDEGATLRLVEYPDESPSATAP